MTRARAGIFVGVLAVLAGGALAEVATKPASMTLGVSSGYLGKAAPTPTRSYRLRRRLAPFGGSLTGPPSWPPVA